ncbi:MAG: CpXC domain-containing protein [Candidatus Promineifilaceae bacterium]
MQTQIQCQQCRQPITANVEQIINVDQNPQLKQLLMQGQLNVATCQNCGWAGQIATPQVYHESAHDLLMTFVPMEARMPYAEQERMMGQMVRMVVESVPQAQRRAYLLQPIQMVRYQTYIERVLETEGITKTMIARQNEQVELLRTLMKADNDVVDYLVKDKARLIDDAFVGMVQQTLQSASQAGAPEAIALSNLSAKLYRETEAGKRVERRQLAMHAFQMEAKAAEGVTADMLADHVVKSQTDDTMVDMLVNAVGGLTYDFFTSLTARIETAAHSGDKPSVMRLTAIRTRLLKTYDEMLEESAKQMKASLDAINAIATSADKMQALQQYANQIDEGFLVVLERETQKAQDDGNLERTVALREVRKYLEDMVNQSGMPQMQFISAMMRVRSDEEINQILDSAPQLVDGQLIEVLDQLSSEVGADAQPEIGAHLQRIRGLIEARL